MDERRDNLLAELRGLDGDHQIAIIHKDWRSLIDVAERIAAVAAELVRLEEEEKNEDD